MKKATRPMISVSFINTLHLDSKSLYISRAVSTSYGIEIEISAGFGPVGIIEKNGPIISNEVDFFMFSGAKRNYIFF